MSRTRRHDREKAFGKPNQPGLKRTLLDRRANNRRAQTLADVRGAVRKPAIGGESMQQFVGTATDTSAVPRKGRRLSEDEQAQRGL